MARFAHDVSISIVDNGRQLLFCSQQGQVWGSPSPGFTPAVAVVGLDEHLAHVLTQAGEVYQVNGRNGPHTLFQKLAG